MTCEICGKPILVHSSNSDVNVYKGSHCGCRRVTRIRTHPGEVIREDFLLPRSVAQFCDQMGNYWGVDRDHVYEVVSGGASVDEKLAKALATYFETTVEFWLNLQQAHDDSIKKSLEQSEP